MTLTPSESFGLKVKLGIIVPYRDRASHLQQFIPYMQQFLRDIPFHIYIIEQSCGKPFNRGKLLNIGFSLAKTFCTYIGLHDVDMLPVQASYAYADCPTHLATRVEQFDYSMPYDRYFGGVTLFNIADFTLVNGYSNHYWGWGLEDDDLRLRCEAAQLHIASREGIFHSLEHARPSEMDPLVQANQERFEEYLYGNKNPQEDGLKQLTFEIIQHKEQEGLSTYLVEI